MASASASVKALVEAAQGRKSLGRHARQLGQRQLGQGDEVLDFDQHAVAHQGHFGEARGQGGGGAGVAPIEGREGE